MAAAGLPVRLRARRRRHDRRGRRAVALDAGLDPRDVRVGRGRARRRRRPGRGRRPGPDGRLAGCRGPRGHACDGRGALPLAVARPAVAQGRDVRQRAAACARSRSTATAMPCCSVSTRRSDLPPRHPLVFRRRTPSRTASPTRAAPPRASPGWSRSGRPSPSVPPTGPGAPTRSRCSTAGVDLAGRKVAEEATEVLLAAKNDEAAQAAGSARDDDPRPARRRDRRPRCTTRWSCSRSVASSRVRVIEVLRARSASQLESALDVPPSV